MIFVYKFIFFDSTQILLDCGVNIGTYTLMMLQGAELGRAEAIDKYKMKSKDLLAPHIYLIRICFDAPIAVFSLVRARRHLLERTIVIFSTSAFFLQQRPVASKEFDRTPLRLHLRRRKKTMQNGKTCRKRKKSSPIDARKRSENG